MLNFKIIRITRGVSQWDLSRETGIPNYRISLIENGRVQPKQEELELLAESLGTTVDVLNDSDQIGELVSMWRKDSQS